MGAHPWKADDLRVRTWDECAEGYADFDEAPDEDLNDVYNRNDLCPYCFFPDPTSLSCYCFEWDDDCWTGGVRPWACKSSPVLEDQPRTAPRLSTKGKLQQREHHLEHVAITTGLARRRKIRRARRRWMVLKDAVDARRIALHWQEQTQRRLCGPGGAGRAADAAAFRDEF